MKSLIVATILLLSVGQPLFSQVDFEGGTDIDDRRIRDFQDQRQSLIDSFMNSRNNRVNLGNDSSGVTFLGGDATGLVDFEGGTDSKPGQVTGGNDSTSGSTGEDQLQDSQTQINSRQLNPNGTGPNYKIDAPDTTQERTAPMHLYFDQIHFESDDVSEVTLKDGTVVKTEELQDFAKEVIMKKLNEQK